MRDRTGGEVSFKMGDETGWFKFPVFAKSRCLDSLCVSGLHAVTRKIMKLTELINHGFQNIFTSKKSSLESNSLIVENSDGFFLPEKQCPDFCQAKLFNCILTACCRKSCTSPERCHHSPPNWCSCRVLLWFFPLRRCCPRSPPSLHNQCHLQRSPAVSSIV